MSVIGLDVGTSRVKAVRFDASWQAADTQAEATAVIRAATGAASRTWTKSGPASSGC